MLTLVYIENGYDQQSAWDLNDNLQSVSSKSSRSNSVQYNQIVSIR